MIARKPFLKSVLVLRWNAALTNTAFSFSVAPATTPSPSSRKHFVIQVVLLATWTFTSTGTNQGTPGAATSPGTSSVAGGSSTTLAAETGIDVLTVR